MSDFKNLKVWQKAHTLALDTHRVACKIRGSNNNGLRTQTIRAAMSVPANIVESRGQLDSDQPAGGGEKNAIWADSIAE